MLHKVTKKGNRKELFTLASKIQSLSRVCNVGTELKARYKTSFRNTVLWYFNIRNAIDQIFVDHPNSKQQ